MRNLKKFLALVLSVMMVLSLVVTASANSISDGKDQVFSDASAIEPKFQKAVEVLNGMDVLKGRGDASGNVLGFDPDKPITRAEVAAMVFRLATGLTDANAADHFAQYGNFSDVKDDAWYAGYVGYCANAGYIKGYAGEYGPFGPSDNVTGYQALAMILRAVGYGVNGEFEGNSWQLEVAAIGQQTGVLDQINSTAFGGATLQQPARRDVVAEIFFQAAQLDRVVYTPAYGYQTTNIQNGTVGQTPVRGKLSLGYLNFGLWKTTRVVVGNQATGETKTILGDESSRVITYTTYGDGTIRGTATMRANEYAYPGTVIRAAGTANSTDPLNNVTAGSLNIDLVSGLDLFGHKVEVWYDDTDTGVHQTYAYYDQATLARKVYASSGDFNDLGDIVAEDSIEPLGTKAKGAGFTVTPTDTIYTSDRYGVIDITPNQKDAAGFTAAVADAEDATATPHIRQDDTATNDRIFYQLISNSADKSVDVIITLAPELARINEHDTTASTKTLTLAGAIGASNWPSTFGTADDGVIRMNSLFEVEGKTTKELGDLVTAWEIKGTAYDVDRLGDPVKVNTDLYKYQLNKIVDTKVGVVSTYNPVTGHVTLTDGTSLDFTLLPIINHSVSKPAADYFYNGREYTFYKDEFGQYVRAVQNTGYEFLYGTFADYEVGGLGTGTIKYAITGVNWDGDKVINADLKSINQVDIAGANYETLTIVKKNLGSANWNNTVGNEIQSGRYTGYGYNKSTGDLMTGYYDSNNDWNSLAHIANAYWDGHMGDADGSFDRACANGLSKTDTWVINKSDVSNGFADLNNPTHNPASVDGDLLATPNTQFILVEGTGTDTLKVDIRNGISGLLGDADSVQIDARVYDDDGITTIDFNNIYYLYVDETYNNVDTSNQLGAGENQMIKTVILPKSAVTWSNTNTLYFTTFTNTSGTGTQLAGLTASDSVQQFPFYKDGVRDYYFVDIAASTNGAGANNYAPIGPANEGAFYNLTKIREHNGTPIYRADLITVVNYPLNSPLAICGTLYNYEYIATNNTATARLTDGNGSTIFNVSNANVTNVSGTGTITNVRELNNAISVGYNVTVAIVNNGLNVSQIYVVACSQ